jgi:hypothetical protein
VFPVRYELNSYINLLRNSVFKGLISAMWGCIPEDYERTDLQLNSNSAKLL